MAGCGALGSAVGPGWKNCGMSREGCRAAALRSTASRLIKIEPPANEAGGHSLSKKILTSMWTGKHAPPPLPPSPVFAEILQISGRKNCRETIFALENGIFRRKNRPCPPYMPLGTIGSSGGLRPSRALLGFSTDSGRQQAKLAAFSYRNTQPCRAQRRRVRSVSTAAISAPAIESPTPGRKPGVS